MSDVNHGLKLVGHPPPDGAIVPTTPGFAGSISNTNPLWEGSPLNPDYVAPANYVSAFDPSGSQYSVNTGNASVRDLETLNAIFSDPPVRPEIKDPNANLYLGAAAILLFYLLMKMKGH